ncbi:hypothetical protein ANMWB30_23040 [Arthrobacter sp. MWB30]|nr:hypothetical protein ANMWB30_23040 [Arthrobacter sp. MWB30]
MSKNRRRQPTYNGYEVLAEISRVERLGNTKSGNPRFRLHTDEGIFLTDGNNQQNSVLTGEETGQMVLVIKGDKAVSWRRPITVNRRNRADSSDLTGNTTR